MRRQQLHLSSSHLVCLPVFPCQPAQLNSLIKRKQNTPSHFCGPTMTEGAMELTGTNLFDFKRAAAQSTPNFELWQRYQHSLSSFWPPPPCSSLPRVCFQLRVLWGEDWSIENIQDSLAYREACEKTTEHHWQMQSCGGEGSRCCWEPEGHRVNAQGQKS